MTGDDYSLRKPTPTLPVSRNVRSLLECNDRKFIESAYQVILNRRADSEGLDFYLYKLRGGTRKIQILGEISNSEEARSTGTELQGLRNALRWQKLAKVPLLGGFFKYIFALEGDSAGEVKMRAIEHQPYILEDLASEMDTRQRVALSAVDQRQGEIQTALLGISGRQSVFESEQLPTLLQTLSNLNHRQLASDNYLNNLVKSVPVSFRKITREIVELRQEVRGEVQNLATENAAVFQATDRRFIEIRARVDDIVNLIDEVGNSIRDQFSNTLTAHSHQLREMVGKISNASNDVVYLLGRVEFVRRELMFELHYGEEAPVAEAAQLKAEIVIVSQDKLAEARIAGIRLNLGCGHIPLEGYLNVDRRSLPSVDIVAEVDDLPFGSGEVEEIFSAHLVEHFPQEQLRRSLLKYWLNILKPGGRFRAVVPDAEAMMKAYFAGEMPFEQLRNVTFGGQDYKGDFHFTMLNTESLGNLLLEAGFVDLKVIAENRVNGDCREFEIAAMRPEGSGL